MTQYVANGAELAALLRAKRGWEPRFTWDETTRKMTARRAGGAEYVGFKLTGPLFRDLLLFDEDDSSLTTTPIYRQKCKGCFGSKKPFR